MKKRFLSLALSLILASSCLTGCGSLFKPLGAEDSKEEAEDKKDKGFLESLGGSADAYEAYKEFYQEFYDEHIDDDITSWDCGGQILLDEDNKPLLALCDLSNTSDRDNTVMADVSVYEYKRGDVKEIARLANFVAGDNFIRIDNVDDEVKLCYRDGITDKGVVCTLKDNDFEKKNLSDEEFELEYRKNWYMEPLYNSFFVENRSLSTLTGFTFESLLSYLVDADPDTVLELKIAYSDFFKDEGYYENPIFRYGKDDCYYLYSSSNNKLYFSGRDAEVSGDILDGLPDEIEGVEVDIASSYIANFISYISPDSIESFELSDEKLIVQRNVGDDSDITLECFIAYDRDTVYNPFSWEANTASGGAEEVAAPAVAEAPAEEAYAEGYEPEEKPVDDGLEHTKWLIYVDGEEKEVSFDEFKTCVDSGLALVLRSETVTVSETDVFIERMILEFEDNESFVSALGDSMPEEFMVENVVIPAYEKYVSDNYGNGEYDVFNLIYIDADDIPELLFDKTADGRGTLVISYQNGEITESDAWCRGYDFNYVPRANKVVYGGIYFEELSGAVAYLEKGVLVNVHMYNNYYDADANSMVYQIDNERFSEEEYNALFDTYFTDEDMIYGWQTYSSIQEAYDNIRK